MSDSERFLARWSRRKRAAAAREHTATIAQPQQEGGPLIAQSAGSATEAEPAIDIADLPPLEAIGPSSDIRAFLSPGVPSALARAALRRAWLADPAIRDFIGLSENSWDFTVPGGVPGFGSVSMEDAKRLLDRLLADPPSADAAPQEGEQAATTPGPVASEAPDCAADNGTARSGATSAEIAAQLQCGTPEPAAQPRRHGGALPE
jgi:hypothetical protein